MEVIMQTKFWPEIPKGIECLGDLGIYGRIVLRWILKEHGVKMWTGFSWTKGLFPSQE
jgi:hypothetical protein